MFKKYLRVALVIVSAFLLLNNCQNPAVGLGKRVDVTAPEVTIESPISGSHFKGVQVFRGSYLDDLAVEKIEISFDNGVVFNPIPQTFGNSTGQWEYSYDSTLEPDGRKIVILKVTDSSGKATSTNASAYTSDNTPPTVLITNPQNYGTSRPDLSTAITLEGRAYDNDFSPLQIQKVYITLLNSDGTPASAKKEANGKESWSVQFIFPPNNGDVNADFPSGLSDVSLLTPPNTGRLYGYTVEAHDGAGNVSTHFYQSSDLFRLLQIGQLFPSMNAIGTLDQSGTGFLTGVGAGASGLSFAEMEALRFPVVSGISGGFFFDRNVDRPVIEVTNLVSTATQTIPVINSRSSIAGVITDDKKPFKWDPSDTPNYDSDYLIATVTPNTGTAFVLGPAAAPKTRAQGNTVNFQMDLVYPAGHSKSGQVLDNGSYTMVLRARDADWVTGSLRNEGLLTVNFMVDNSAPAFISVAPNSGTELAGSGDKVTLTVVVEDDSKDLTLLVKHGEVLTSLLDLAGTSITHPNADVEVIKDSKTYYQRTFLVEIPLMAFQDKVYVKMSSKDTAGFEGFSNDLEYIIDRDPPSITVDTIPAWISLFEGGSTATASVSGTAVGSNSVYFLLQAQGAAAPAISTSSPWVKATGNSKWNGSVIVATKDGGGAPLAFEGLYSLYVYSIDAAGNVSTRLQQDFGVDQARPVVTQRTANFDGVPAGDTALGEGFNYRSEKFNLKVNAVDSYGVQSVVVAATPAAGVVFGTPAIVGNDRIYEVTLPADGTYEISSTVTDLAGQSTVLKRTVVLDTVGPELLISNLNFPGATSLTDASYVIRGTTSDTSGVALVEYSLDSGATWAAATGTQSWSVSVADLIEGPGQTIRFRATDIRGFVTTSGNYLFGRDTASPTLFVTNLGTYNNTHQSLDFSLTGTAQDMSGIGSVKVSIDGGTNYVTIPGANSIDNTLVNWTFPITVALGGADDGAKAIRVQTIDIVNKVTTVALNVTFDTSAPTFTPSNLVSAQLITGIPYTVSGSWSDNGGSGTTTGSAKMEYSLDNSVWTALTSTASTWNGAIPFVQGLNRSLYLRSTDKVGNVSSSFPITGLTVDTDLPGTSVDHTGGFVEGTWANPQYKNAGFSLSGTSTDTLGVSSVAATANPAAGAGIGAMTLNAGTTSRTWTVPVNPTVDGTFQYTITVTDVAGRTKTESRSITRDTTPPTIAVLNLADGAGISTTSYLISGSASDANGLSAIEYRLDMNADGDYVDAGETDWTSVSTVGQSWSQTVSGLTEGAGLKIQFQARDSSGLTTTLPIINFGLDLSPPAHTVTTVDGTAWGAWVNGTSKNGDFNIVGASSDANKIKLLEISLDGGNSWQNMTDSPDPLLSGTFATPINWTESVTVAALGANDGLKAIKVRATDAYNKTTERSFTVKFDTSAPTLNVNNLVNGQLITSTPFGVNGTWSDNGGSGTTGGSASVEAKIGAGPWTSVAGITTSTWSESLALVQGLNQTIQFRGTDSVGNTSTATSITGVNVDTALPATAVNHDGVSYTEGSWGTTVYKKAAYQLRGTASDTLGVASVTVTAVPAGTAGVGAVTLNAGTTSRTWSVPITPTAVGSYEFTITVTDTAGRTTVEKRTVVYDDVIPTTAYVSPTAGSWSNSASVTVSGTSDDGTGSGIRKVFYVLDNAGLAVPADPTVDANWTGAGWTAFAGSSSFNTILSGLSEGSHTMRIASVDQAGNLSTPSNRSFNVDLNDPTVAVDGSVTLTLTNTNWTVFGTAGDSNSLSTTVISATKNSLSQGVMTNAGTAAAWSYTLASDPNSNGDHANDGFWVFTITATDAAGKTKITTKSVTLDTTAPSGAVVSPTNLEIVGGTTYNFTGSASDAGSGVASVRVAFASDGTGSVLAAGTSSWSSNITLLSALVTEGNKTVYVQVTDNAANASVWTSVTRNFIYDTASPVMSLTGAATRATNTGFTLSGTAFENYGLDAVTSWTVTQKKDSGAVVPITTTPAVLGGAVPNQTWSLASLPRNPGSIGVQSLTDGVYVYTFTSKDLAGRDSNVISVTVTLDQTAPETLTITNPSAGQTGLNSLSGGAYTFRGTATDSGVGVASVYYLINQGAAPAGIAGYTLLNTTGPWNFTDDFDTDGVGADTGRAEGSWNLHLKATDSSGNITADGAVVTVAFGIDQANPTLVENVVNTTAVTNKALGYSLGGTSTDTYGVASISVTQAKDGGSVVPVTTNGPSGTTSWTLANLPRNPASIGVQALVDGIYEYVITVTDLAGKTTVLNRTVRLDTTDPILTIAAPAASEIVSVSTKTFSGSVNDGSGSGVASVEYSLDSTDGIDGTWTSTVPVGSSWSFPNVALGAEGSKSVYFRATDLMANQFVSSQINFFYDSGAPTLAETTIGTTTEQLTNVDAVLSGTASDGNALTSVVITATQNGADQGILHTDAASPAAWTYTHTASVGNNGLWVFTITALDAAGRTTTVVRTVRIDTVAPAPSITLPLAASYVSGSSYTATGSIVEANTLASVEYSTNNTNWFSATGLGSWTVNLNLLTLGEGDKTLYIRATDTAGNLSSTVTRAFRVDTNAPGLTETAVGTGAVYKNATFTLSGNLTDNVDLSTLTVTQNKDGAGAVQVYTTNYATANDTSSAWSLPNMPDGGAVSGQYEYIITVLDTSGKTTSVTRSVTVDTTQPNLEITSILPILTGANVNGIITLSVNTSDANGLTGVKYFMVTSGTPVYTDAVAAPSSGTLAAPYNTQIDTTLLSNNTAYTLWVITRDKAGNDRAVSTTLNVNQSSDTPTGAIDSPADTDALGADKRLRGTFSDDDGVASAGAILYIRKTGAPSYTSRSLNLVSSAGQLVSWNYDVTPDLAGDGTYQYYLTVGDNAANKLGKGSVTFTGPVQTFTYDVTPPTVSAIGVSPVQGAFKATDVVTFSWTATDDSGVGTQAVDIDGVATGLGAITNPSGSNYQVIYTVPSSGLVSGNKTLTLVTPDTTGRAATRTVTILIDIDVPVVENAFTVNPSFVGYVPNGAFDLKGTASDNRGLDRVELSYSTDDVTYGAYASVTLSNGNWTHSIANSAALIPGSGTLYFRVRAVDQAGNTSTIRQFSQVVNQASDLAVASVLSPANSGSYGTTIQVTGSLSDDDNLADINNDSILDLTGVEIEYEGLAPVVAPTTVNAGSITGSGKNANFNRSLTIATGSWRVRVRTQDDLGTWGSWSSYNVFSVDTGAPNLVLDTVIPTFTANSSLTLSGSVEDASGVKYVKVSINGGAFVLVNGAGMVDANVDGVWDSPPTGLTTWSINLNLGTDGLKTLELKAEDTASFVATVQRSTTLDSTPPSATFDAQFRDNPSGSFLSKSLLNKVVRITGTVTELNLADTNPVEISINGGAFAPVTGTFVWSYVWDTTLLTNGVYSLALRITDKAGNVNTSVIDSVTTLQSADIPVITQAFVAAANSAAAGNNVLGALLKVSGTISDDDGFLSGAVKVYVDGGAALAATNNVGTTTTWDYTWGALAAGEHYYSIEATDRNGLVTTLGPTYFLVDTLNPVLNATAPVAAAKVKAGNLAITGTVSDDGGLGATPLSITLRHSSGVSSALHNVTFTPAVGGGNFTQNVTIDGTSLDGTLFIDFVLSDRAGKQSSLTRAITIDTSAPVLNLNYPSSAAYVNGLISFLGTADDLNGLTDVSLQLLAPGTYLPVATITRSGSTLSSWEFPFNAFSYATTTYGVDVNADGKLWKVLFRLSATDASGNVQEYKINNPANNDWPYIFIDTDGDKPIISVTQPKNGDNVGGILNMFGSASDDDGPVMQVEVQIDYNGDGDFADSRDINNNDADANPLTGIALGADQTFVSTTVRVGNPAQKWEDESAWYVVSVSNGSWSQELNGIGELYASNTAGTGNIVIRVRSRDIFGLASEISTRTITLDETFPRIENVSPNDQTYQSSVINFLAEYGDNIDLNLGSNSVLRVNINKTGYVTLTPGANSGPGWSGTLTAALGAPQHGYDLALSLDTNHFFPNSSGIFYVDLYIKDESNYTNQKSYTYYIDNQTPTSSWSDRPGSPDGLNLRNGQVRINGNVALDYAFLEGNYLDSGSVSGVDRVEVYFEKAGTIRRIKGSSGSMAPVSTASVPVETYSEGTGLWSTANETLGYITHASPGASDNYVIKIDRATEMSSISTGADSDADGFYEFLGIDGGAQRFRAYFDSQYLPDGEIDIHYIIYDLAGNKVHKVRRGFISNNGPSYSRIRIGSDLNGNGTVADVAGAVTEIADYYYPVGSIDRYASSQPVKIKNGKLHFNVISSDPNGTIANTTVNIVAPSPGTRGLLTSFGGASGGTVTTSPDLTIIVGSAQFPTAGDYTLEVVVKDNDNIAVRRTMIITVLNTTDGSAPILTPTVLSQANAIPMDETVNPALDADSVNEAMGHLEIQGDNTGPVWATIIAAYGSDNDPKISGDIFLKGTITEENRLSGLDITGDGLGTNTSIATWDGTKITSSNARLTIDSQSLTEDGHTLSFTYRWDTSTVTGVSALNRTVAFRATDAGTNTSLAHSTLKFDVVPYITGMTTGLSTAFPSNPSVIQRASSGAYSVRENESITAAGFNFGGVSTTVSLNGTGITPSSGSSTSLILPVGATATSGPLTLSVNAQTSINNLDDNGQTYNKQSNNMNNLLLNNDVRFHIWRISAVVANTVIRYPTFRIGTDAGQTVGFAYASGAQEARTTINGATAKFEGSWTQFYDTALALDSTGRWYAGAMNADSGVNADQDMNGGGAGWANFGFYAWQAGSNIANSSGAYTAGSHKRLIENANSNTAASPVFTSQRILSPKISTWVNGGTTSIFMTYYDAPNNQVRYRYGTVGGTYPATPTFGGNLVNHNNVAGGSGTGYHVAADGATGFKAGQYTASGVTNDGLTALMAWYDATNQSLVFSYNTSPATASAAQWQTNALTIDSDFAGWYVDMAVDSNNGIHLAYYSSSNGDLRYAYLSAYNDLTPEVATVDSFLGVGTNLSIAVNQVGVNQVPYISYSMGAFSATRFSARTAWRTDFTGAVPQGVVTDQFTGSWEITTIPTPNNPKDYTIGIGVKDLGSATDQPMLGYATNLGLETAQLK